MARLALIYGNDPLTRRLAEEIIASQTVEISAMNERLKILRHGETRTQPDSQRCTALGACAKYIQWRSDAELGTSQVGKRSIFLSCCLQSELIEGGRLFSRV